MTHKITNVPLKDYRRFLKYVGCKEIRTKGGHEIWTRSDLQRSLALQTHIDPVPARIIRQHLQYLKLSKEDFLIKLSEAN